MNIKMIASNIDTNSPETLNAIHEKVFALIYDHWDIPFEIDERGWVKDLNFEASFKKSDLFSQEIAKIESDPNKYKEKLLAKKITMLVILDGNSMSVAKLDGELGPDSKWDVENIDEEYKNCKFAEKQIFTVPFKPIFGNLYPENVETGTF